MPTLEVDPDIYLHIARNTKVIGESASDILRRLLGLQKVVGGSAVPAARENHELAAAIGEPRFLMQSSVVDRYLHLLSVVHGQRKTEFEKILAIRGRGRKYFANSREEIETSGNSTQPKSIPGTPYWALTNSPTVQKKEVLGDALRLLGYGELAVRQAMEAIE